MFSELALPSTMYRNGSPEPIVDYRDFPILTVAGDTSIAVSYIMLFAVMHMYAFHATENLFTVCTKIVCLSKRLSCSKKNW